MASVQVGDVESARAQADESLALARLLEGPLLIVCALEAVAAVDRAAGNATSAASALEEARRVGSAGAVPMKERHFSPRPPRWHARSATVGVWRVRRRYSTRCKRPQRRS